MPRAAETMPLTRRSERALLEQEMRARDAENALDLALSMSARAGYPDVAHALLGMKMRVAQRRRNVDRRG